MAIMQLIGNLFLDGYLVTLKKYSGPLNGRWVTAETQNEVVVMVSEWQSKTELPVN